MTRKRATKKKTAFVPRSLFRASALGGSVVPLCASLGLAWLEPGCGGGGPLESVACICFDGGEPSCCAGVAASCFTDPSLPGCDAGDGGGDAMADGPGGDAPDAAEAGSSDGDAADGSGSTEAGGDAASAGDGRETGG